MTILSLTNDVQWTTPLASMTSKKWKLNMICFDIPTGSAAMPTFDMTVNRELPSLVPAAPVSPVEPLLASFAVQAPHASPWPNSLSSTASHQSPVAAPPRQTSPLNIFEGDLTMSRVGSAAMGAANEEIAASPSVAKSHSAKDIVLVDWTKDMPGMQVPHMLSQPRDAHNTHMWSM